MPDFYFVAPHGTGSFSLAYYLKTLGIGCFRQSTRGDMREYIAGQTHCLGLNIDNSKPSEENEKACIKRGGGVPTVWLVRDPVDLLCSNCNFIISSSILRCSAWQQQLPVKYLVPEMLLEYLLLGEVNPYYCNYSSQLLKVKPFPLLCLDTSELSSEHIESSLRSIWELLERDQEREFVLDTSTVGKNFNSFKSRMQIFFSQLSLDECPGIRIHIYTKDYFPYMRYTKMWTENILLFDLYNFTIDGNTYVLCLQCDNFDMVKKSAESIFARFEKYISGYIRMRNSYLQSVSLTLDAFKITSQRILEILEADKRLKTHFLRTQHKELRLVKKFRPDLLERWTSFAQIGADIW